MILMELFLGFLKVGCFAFGGAYSAIPLIREIVLGHGWLGDEALTHMIAVSESTPGPIMVNLATYVGSSQVGFPGAVLATLAVVLPSFLIILMVMGALRKVMKNRYVQAVLRGMKPCIIGIILATGVHMTLKSCFPQPGGTDVAAIVIASILIGGSLLYGKLKRKKLSPIALIVLSAVLGLIFY